MTHQSAVAMCGLLLLASAHAENVCVDADPITQKAFGKLAKSYAPTSLKIAIDDVMVFRVMECGENIEVVGFHRRRILNLDFLFERRTKKLLKAEAGDG